jgi:hypothetical protein
MKQAADAQKLQHETQMQALKEQGAQADLKQNQVMQAIDQHFATLKAHMELAGSAQLHNLNLQQTQESHQQKLQQAREAKPKTKG